MSVWIHDSHTINYSVTFTFETVNVAFLISPHKKMYKQRGEYSPQVSVITYLNRGRVQTELTCNIKNKRVIRI